MIKKIFIRLGEVDRRYIFLIISLSVLLPLLYQPEWLKIDYEVSPNTQTVFNELSDLKEGDRILISFAYGASTMPEIHPMSVALLQHMFAKGVEVYMIALWPEGVIMATDALEKVLSSGLFKVEENEHYINLGYKAGGAVVIKGIATDMRALYKQDVNLNFIDDIEMMKDVKNISDFDFVFDLSAGVPGNAEWVQYACDEYKIPLSSGCTSIMVTDAIPYIQSGQLLGILAGMPGAAEYEGLVSDFLEKTKNTNVRMNSNIAIPIGIAESRMPAQSISHLMMVLFVVLGNISYYLKRKEK